MHRLIERITNFIDGREVPSNFCKEAFIKMEINGFIKHEFPDLNLPNGYVSIDYDGWSHKTIPIFKKEFEEQLLIHYPEEFI